MVEAFYIPSELLVLN